MAVTALVLVGLPLLASGFLPSAGPAAGLRRGGAPLGAGLEGRAVVVDLDLGREKNTWMPPTWACRGTRVELSLILELQPGGRVAPRKQGPYINIGAREGRWTVDARDALQIALPIEGYSREDNELPPCVLYMSIATLGGKRVSRSKGNLTIQQTRWFIRKERRLVGTVRLREELVDLEGIGDVVLPPSRSYTDMINIR
uniref:Uncharacterized protein n=1 Tax=Rhizochromulina marina TaxID=1034831 RepID=A0A7S2RWP7_9STRA|mmetsp:Transcript_22105/g.64148  ORF Transcript_22105/g.64148 Transcript_22105/m.64148 type:complete len:199 (+) Transcript_22105:35-631(+)